MADPLDKQLVEAVLTRPRRAKADVEEARLATRNLRAAGSDVPKQQRPEPINSPGLLRAATPIDERQRDPGPRAAHVDLLGAAARCEASATEMGSAGADGRATRGGRGPARGGRRGSPQLGRRVPGRADRRAGRLRRSSAALEFRRPALVTTASTTPVAGW